MPGNASLLGFIAAALVVLVIPGPGVSYTIARSLSEELRAGLVSVLGLSVGALVHVAVATVGLSAILLTSATALVIVKALGAVYLIYLGLQALLTRHRADEADVSIPRSLYRLFAHGVVSVLNPKIAVFFLAFLAQFVAPNEGHVAQQVLFLGILYVVLAIFTDGGYALLAGSVRRWFGGRVAQGPLPRCATGVVHIGLGVRTALTDRP